MGGRGPPGFPTGAPGHAVGAQDLAPLHAPPRRAAKSLGSMIAGYKMAVTKRVNAQRETPGAPVWQRNYHEHVIRTQAALRAIREYIVRNPERWQMDPLIIGRPLVGRDQLALILIRLGDLGRERGGEFVGAEHLAHFELDLASPIDCRPTLDPVERPLQ